MTEIDQDELLSRLSTLERKFNHDEISESEFRKGMAALGLQEWEIDEFVDDKYAEEP
jgi:hypothetical protein